MAATAAAAAHKGEVASAGSNPSTSATKEQLGAAVQEAASAQQHPQHVRVKQEDGGASAAAAAATAPLPAVSVPVELEPRPSAKAQQLGSLVVAGQGSYSDLVASLQAAFADKLPRKPGMRLVYQDMDGDWLLLLPDVPWRLFASTVRRLLVTYK